MQALQTATAELLAARPKPLQPHELHTNAAAAPPIALTRCGTLKTIQLHEADLVYAMDESRRRLVAGASEHMASQFVATFRGVLAGGASPSCHHYHVEDGCSTTTSPPLATPPPGPAANAAAAAAAARRRSPLVSGASFEVAAAIEAAAIAAIPDAPEAHDALPPATVARKARMADRRLRPMDSPPRVASNLLVRDPRFSSDMTP